MLLYLFREQGITIVEILTALFMIISTIGIAISGIFVGGGEDFAASGSFSPKDERALKKWLVKQASRCPQNTYWKGF